MGDGPGAAWLLSKKSRSQSADGVDERAVLQRPPWQGTVCAPGGGGAGKTLLSAI